MQIEVAAAVSASIHDVPDVTITVPPTTIQSWTVKGRSGQYHLSDVHRKAWPLTDIPSARYEGSATGRSWSQWLVEPLTNQPAGLFKGIPMLCHRRDGSAFVRWAYNQSGNTPEEAYSDYVSGKFKPAVFEGPRNFNATTGYTTYRPDPDHTGWWGLDKMVGWLFCVRPNGGMWTAAGDETPVEDGRIYYGERKRTGTFDKFWKLVTDMRLDPRDKHVIYVCDPQQNRVTRTDWTWVNQVAWSHTQTYVEIPGAYSLDVLPDGSMFVASRTENRIYAVSPTKQISIAVPSCADIQQVALTSNGEITWGARQNKNLYHWQNGANRLVNNIAGASQAWWWYDIDTTGSIGPKDDIIATVSHTTPGTPIRLSLDGTYKSTGPNGGPLRTGRIVRSGYGNAVTDNALHYGWGIAIHHLSARFVCAGFGDVAHTVWRRARTNDGANFNYNAYIAGRSQHEWGDATFPSMITLHGPNGFSYTGLPNFDELAYWNDTTLNAYIRSGMGGTLPARTFSDQNLKDYRYYIRMNSVRGVMENIVY